MSRLAVSVVLSLGLSVSQVDAQQRPTIGYVYPAGGIAGKTIEVQLGGYDWTPDTQFFLLDDRVKLEQLSQVGPLIYPGAPYWFGPRALNSYKPFPIPREITARITIPADMPAGAIHWQVANANGASESGKFMISREIDEFTEEDLTLEESARRLPTLPLIINGRLEKKEEVDRYRFTAAHTGLITCELPNQDIGFPLQASIRITDDSGRDVVDHVDTSGRGTYLTFAVNKGTCYTLVLHDLDYRGNRAMVYRLSMRRGPRVVAMMPTSVVPNSRTKITFVGYGIASGQARLETLEQTVSSPLESFSYDVLTEHGPAGSIEIPVTAVAEHVVETAKRGQAASLTLPVRVCGVFDDPRGWNVYTFAGHQGDVWTIDLCARTSATKLDVMFSVHDADGRVIAKSDDALGTLNAQAPVTIPADGPYHLLVTDQASAGGSIAAVYRLCIDRPQPGFRMTAPAKVETLIGAEPMTPSKRRRAGKQQTGVIGIDVQRLGGFDSEITLRIESLPRGFHVPDEIKIDAKQAGVDIPISCDPDVSPDASFVVVQATASLDDGSVLSQQSRLLLTPMLKPKVVIRPKYPDAARTVNRGTTYPAPVVVERLDQYEGPVELQMAAVPDRVRQGILGHPCTIRAGENEGSFPLIIPEWVQTDRTSRIILNSVVTVPDANGRMRYLVNRMDRRITMNVEGALLKISTPSNYYQFHGESIAIPIELFRSGKLKGAVVVSLHATDPDRPALTAKPITLTAAQRSGELELVPTAGKHTEREQNYVVRARAEHQGYPVLSETTLVLSTLPPTPVASNRSGHP